MDTGRRARRGRAQLTPTPAPWLPAPSEGWPVRHDDAHSRSFIRTSTASLRQAITACQLLLLLLLLLVVSEHRVRVRRAGSQGSAGVDQKNRRRRYDRALRTSDTILHARQNSSFSKRVS